MWSSYTAAIGAKAFYSALVTFVRKLSSALAIFAVSHTLEWAGYVSPLPDVTGGITRLVAQPPIRDRPVRAAPDLHAAPDPAPGVRFVLRRVTRSRRNCMSA